ncbi:MAG TPA: hypothetical protein VGY66_09440 [Gemmataceae bacterium]|jgi:hypothetical protein|nr:hypothetical protein [Gemmataceae bacterium]
MACLIAEIVALIGGIMAIAKGQIRMLGSRTVEGTPARIAGVILILPLPLALVAGFMYGVILASQGREFDEKAKPIAAIMEAAIFLVCMTAAVIVTLTAKQPRRRRRSLEDDDDFDDGLPRPSRPGALPMPEEDLEERFEERKVKRRPSPPDDLDQL